MARALRLEFEDALYHLCARGNRREQIFAAEKDYQRFEELLAQSLERYQVELHAYILCQITFIYSHVRSGVLFGGIDYAAVSQRVRRVDKHMAKRKQLRKTCEILNV